MIFKAICEIWSELQNMADSVDIYCVYYKCDLRISINSWHVSYTSRSQQTSGSSAGTSIYAERQGVQVQVCYPYPLLALDLPRGIWGLPGTWQKPFLLTSASWRWSHNQIAEGREFSPLPLKVLLSGRAAMCITHEGILEGLCWPPLSRLQHLSGEDHHTLSLLCFIGWAPWNTGLASKGNAHQIHSCWSNSAEASGIIYVQHDMLGL